KAINPWFLLVSIDKESRYAALSWNTSTLPEEDPISHIGVFNVESSEFRHIKPPTDEFSIASIAINTGGRLCVSGYTLVKHEDPDRLPVASRWSVWCRLFNSNNSWENLLPDRMPDVPIGS